MESAKSALTLEKSESLSAFGKAFVKTNDQYQIQEIRRKDSSHRGSTNTIDANKFINDIRDVEEVLFDLQNNYVNLEAKVKDQVQRFSEKIQSQVNVIDRNVEFTNNQMNVYMQMIHQDLEILKGKSK